MSTILSLPIHIFLSGPDVSFTEYMFLLAIEKLSGNHHLLPCIRIDRFVIGRLAVRYFAIHKLAFGYQILFNVICSTLKSCIHLL